MVEVLPVVVVHWDRAERCVATVVALVEQSTGDLQVEPLVVDNGSCPDVLDALRAGLAGQGLDVPILELGENRGFGPGANAGFRHLLRLDGDGSEPEPEPGSGASAGPGGGAGPANGGTGWLDGDGSGEPPPRWIGLVPHDALPQPGCLAAVVAAADARPRAGLACADFGDGATPVVDPYFGGILGPATVTEGWEPADHPHGTLMLARADLLAEVGLFDERYFSYCEEADLGLRARAAGWEVGLVRGALVRNPDLGTRTAAVDYLQLRNTLLLVRDHSGAYHAFIRSCLAVLQLGVGLVAPSRRGPYFDARARLRALADHARGRYGPPPADLLAR